MRKVLVPLRVGVLIVVLGIALPSFARVGQDGEPRAGFVNRCLQIFAQPQDEPLEEIAVSHALQPGSYHGFFDDSSIVAKVAVDYLDRDSTDTSDLEDRRTVRSRYDSIAAVINSRPVTDQIKTVLYPGSGHDAAAAFTLFNKADVVIGVDRHPFAALNEIVVPLLKPDEERTRGWALRTNVGSGPDGKIVRATIGLMKAYDPSTRILHIFAFQDRDGHIHGQIDFDHGPGTPKKTFIHIQGDLIDTVDEDFWLNKWWGQKVMATDYQGLLIKASMTLFGGYNSILGREQILAHKLGQKGGVILDGDNSFKNFYNNNYAIEFVPIPSMQKLGYAASADIILVGPWATPTATSGRRLYQLQQAR